MAGQCIMVQGTASDVGKSVVVQALCRHYADRGLDVFPFKSQNMSYSYVTQTGDLMSMSQAQQALAARKEPDAAMNPILLRPSHDAGSEVIIRGKSLGYMSAQAYHEFKPQLAADLKKWVNHHKATHDLLIMEGAGSPAEINLNDRDIVNMGLARLAASPVILLADIDRGGVFASIYGTLALLEPEDRARVKGLIINKFRGDPALLENGLDQIQSLTGLPVIGVIPAFDLPLVDEDSLALNQVSRLIDPTKDLDIAIVNFRRLIGWPDYRSLMNQEDVHVRLVDSGRALRQPDLIILPDHQQVSANVKWLEDNGLSQALEETASSIIAFNHGALHLAEHWQADDQRGRGMGRLKGQVSLQTVPPRRHAVGYQTAQLQGEGTYGSVTLSSRLGLFACEDWTRTYLNKIREKKSLPPLDPSQADQADRVIDQLSQHVTAHIDMGALDRMIFARS